MVKMFLIVSIIEIIYIIYIFNYFKTTIEFHHPFEILITNINEYLKHPIGTGIYESKICKLGNDLSYIFSLFIIIRYIVHEKAFLPAKTLSYINISLIVFIVFLSLLMNLNAFIYLIPLLILEYFYINKIIIDNDNI